MATVLDPQGVPRDIPDDQVGAATQAGGKLATRVQAPDNSLRWIPNEHLDAAQKAGGLVIPDLNAKPNISMEQSTLGTLQSGPTGNAPNQTLPSPKGQMAEDTTPSPAVGAVTVGSAAAIPAGMAAEAVGSAGVFKALADAAESHPVVAKLLLHGLEAAGLGALLKFGKH